MKRVVERAEAGEVARKQAVRGDNDEAVGRVGRRAGGQVEGPDFGQSVAADVPRGPDMTGRLAVAARPSGRT